MLNHYCRNFLTLFLNCPTTIIYRCRERLLLDKVLLSLRNVTHASKCLPRLVTTTQPRPVSLTKCIHFLKEKKQKNQKLLPQQNVNNTSTTQTILNMDSLCRTKNHLCWVWWGLSKWSHPNLNVTYRLNIQHVWVNLWVTLYKSETYLKDSKVVLCRSRQLQKAPWRQVIWQLATSLVLR